MDEFRNNILLSLPYAEREALYPHLHHMTLISNQVLYEQNTAILDAYFVEEGVVSVSANTLDSGHVEVGLTGREGFVGASVILNAKPHSVHRAFLQVKGSAYRIRASDLRAAISQSPELLNRCLCYIEYLLIQTSQVAACNARHSLSERLARWLLMVRDRIDSDNLPMTHNFLSVMLGVRRAGVTIAVGTLQDAGLVGVSRGQVSILDHPGLVEASCECYRIVRDSQTRILTVPPEAAIVTT